jgi:phage/plasmid-associated DNA primase
MNLNSLRLDERFNAPSIFSIVHEYVNPQHVHHIKQSSNRTIALKNNYPSDYHFLDAYTYQWCEGLCCFITKWKIKPDAHGWGRIYPCGPSMSICHRPTRHTLCSDYVDFDMRNCQPEIVKNLMVQFGFKCESIVEYCRDHKKYQHFFAKQDFITVLNGGFNPHPFLRSIQAEIEPFVKAVREQNPHIQVHEKTNHSFLSYYLQSIERYLQESAVQELVEKYHIPLREIIPCQDGFMIRKQYYKEGMLPTITDNWTLKPMNEAYEWHTTSVPYLPFDFRIYGHAEFAKLLAHVCKFDNILSTGQDKFLEAYQFDVYWRPLPLHNAMFQQDSFEKLRDWCRNKIGLFERATYACLEEVSDEKALRERKQEFLKTQALLEKQYIARRKTFEKEQATAYKEFTKRKQVYEKAEKEKYPKQFEKKDFTELFVKAEWMEDDLETKIDQNNKLQKYIKKLVDQENNLRNLSMLKERDSIIQILLRQAYRSHVEWNKNPYLFAFENCIFDIQTKQKVIPTQDQYINLSCGYAYDDHYDSTRVDALQTLIESILPIERVRTYWMAKQATMLTQEHPQYLFIQTGSGSNGKSVLTDLTMNMLGKYGSKLPSDFLQTPMKNGPNPTIANLRGVRAIFCSEPEATKRMSASVVKEITGDGTIHGRGLYQSNCEIKLMCTASLDANKIPNIDTVEYAMDRRLKPIPFNTKAVSQQEYDLAEDKTFLVVQNRMYAEETWRDENKQAFFQILMQQYSQFNFNDLPPECVERKMKYLNASSDIYGFVTEFYEPCDPETSTPIKFKDIYNLFKSSSVFKAFTKDQQREFNYSFYCEKIKQEPALQTSIRLRDQRHKGVQLKTDCLVGWKTEDAEALDAMDGI